MPFSTPITTDLPFFSCTSKDDMSIWTEETITVQGNVEGQEKTTMEEMDINEDDSKDSRFNPAFDAESEDHELVDDTKKPVFIGVPSPTHYYDAFSQRDGFFQGQEKIPVVDDDGYYEIAEDTRCKKIQAFDGTGWRCTSYEGDGPHMFDDDSSL